MSIMHGHARRGLSSREYHSWAMMKERCLNANHPKYKTYGAKGIRVCKRWMKFENFLVDMGLRPEGTTLDRFPNSRRIYCKRNCRWATPKQQKENSTSQIKDIRGKIFGMWTVVRSAGIGKGGARWWCKCECGRLKNVVGYSLTLGRSRCCGCLDERNDNGRF